MDFVAKTRTLDKRKLTIKRIPRQTRFGWFVILSTFLVASCIMTILSMLNIKTIDKPAGSADAGGDGGSTPLWLLCQIFTTTLANVAAAAMIEYPGKSRGRDWCGTSMMLAVTLVCGILILPMYLGMSAYWGEFLGLLCIFLVSVLFCLTAIRLATQAARERRQAAPGVNLEER